MAATDSDSTFSLSVLTAYTMAFSVATVAFVQGLLGRPAYLPVALWVALSIPIAWARRRQSLREGRWMEPPSAELGFDGWARKAIVWLGGAAVAAAFLIAILASRWA